jgi:hypothetical protein
VAELLFLRLPVTLAESRVAVVALGFPPAQSPNISFSPFLCQIENVDVRL